MTITKVGCEELAAQFCSGFCEGWKENNHDETMKKFFADKVSWSWSDGTAGEGRVGELMDLMKQHGEMVGSYIMAKPLVCVDTDQARIVIASQIAFTLVETGDLCTNNLVQILKLNDDMKIQRWSAIYDANEPKGAEAMAKLAAKAKIPKPMLNAKPSMTVEEGQAYVNEYLKTVRDGFAENNHSELSARFFADRLSWDMSDGTKGEGSLDEFFDIVAKGWGPMIDSWLYAEPIVAVDTNRSIVAFVLTAVGNVTGGIKTENNAFVNNLSFVMHLNEDKKCYKWHHAWDNNEPTLKAAVAKVTKHLEAEAKIWPPSEWHSEEVAAGQ